jgi:drug/metabolite transporter (DMT)-like permease
MLVTGAMFVAVTAIVKHIGPGLPAAESGFLRYLLGLVFLIPMIRPIIRARLTRRQIWLFCLRGAGHSIAVTLWFFAMTRITIAEVTALNYMAPVYVTLGAVFFLGERLAARRIVAIGVAFLGAMLILRPGFRELSPGHWAMIAAALIFGVSYLVTKVLASETSAVVIVGMLSITVTIGLAPMAIAVWVPPTTEQLLWIFLVAVFATAGHYTMTLAFAAAPVSVTQPVTFLQLVWAVLLGWLVFDEAVDAWVVTGGGLILMAVSFIAWREHVLKAHAGQAEKEDAA